MTLPQLNTWVHGAKTCTLHAPFTAAPVEPELPELEPDELALAAPLLPLEEPVVVDELDEPLDAEALELLAPLDADVPEPLEADEDALEPLEADAPETPLLEDALALLDDAVAAALELLVVAVPLVVPLVVELPASPEGF